MQSLFHVRGKSRLGQNKSLGNGHTIKGQVQTNHERYGTKVRGLAVFFFLSPKFVTQVEWQPSKILFSQIWQLQIMIFYESELFLASFYIFTPHLNLGQNLAIF
jgi:hypothetical protein